MPNPVYAYILNIYDLLMNIIFVDNIFKQVWGHLFINSYMVSNISILL